MHEKVHEFCKRQYLKQKHTLKIKSNKHREYVYLDDPLVLSRLAGHLKHNLGQPSKGNQIFIRGQTNDHCGMVPSIFRNLPNMNNNYGNRIKAYKELICDIRKIHNLKRFKGEIGSAVLQHYGIRTPWVDFVDNLFIALWFATRERTSGEPFQYVKKNEEDYGWIYFIQVENPSNTALMQSNEGIVVGKKTRWCDLRCYQTSLTLRAHTQHGIFASRYGWNDKNYDLDEFIVATVKFPITSKFISLMGDFNLSTGYMFPSSFYDHTYKKLKNGKVAELIRKVEKNNKLKEGELGKIYEYVLIDASTSPNSEYPA